MEAGYAGLKKVVGTRGVVIGGDADGGRCLRGNRMWWPDSWEGGSREQIRKVADEEVGEEYQGTNVGGLCITLSTM